MIMEKKIEYQSPDLEITELSEGDIILLSWSDDSLNLDTPSGKWSVDW